MFQIFFTSTDRTFDPSTHVTFPVIMTFHITWQSFELCVTQFAIVDLPAPNF